MSLYLYLFQYLKLALLSKNYLNIYIVFSIIDLIKWIKSKYQLNSVSIPVF